jgi:hypothetical protein
MIPGGAAQPLEKVLPWWGWAAETVATKQAERGVGSNALS